MCEPKTDPSTPTAKINQVIVRLELQLEKDTFETLARHQRKRLDLRREGSHHLVEQLVDNPPGGDLGEDFVEPLRRRCERLGHVGSGIVSHAATLNGPVPPRQGTESDTPSVEKVVRRVHALGNSGRSCQMTTR